MLKDLITLQNHMDTNVYNATTSKHEQEVADEIVLKSQPEGMVKKSSGENSDKDENQRFPANRSLTNSEFNEKSACCAVQGVTKGKQFGTRITTFNRAVRSQEVTREANASGTQGSKEEKAVGMQGSREEKAIGTQTSLEKPNLESQAFTGKSKEVEDLELQAWEKLRKTISSLQSYSEFPVKSDRNRNEFQNPVRDDEHDENNETDNEESRTNIVFMRRLALRSAATAPFTSEEISRDSSAFEVSKILSNQPDIPEDRSTIPELPPDHNHLFYETLRNKRLLLGPSGLVQTRNWDNVVARLKCHTRGTSDPAVPVGPHTTYAGLATRVTEIQDLPGGDRSIKAYCTICQKRVQTLVLYESGLFTYIAAICCIVFPVLILCVWIPFLFTSFMDVKHACPICGSVLGRFRRI